MAQGRKTGGRRKGTPNKASAKVKTDIIDAFEQLGGVEGLVEWGKENKDEFYKLWGRMAPQVSELSGPDEPSRGARRRG